MNTAQQGFPWKGVLLGCGLTSLVGVVLLCAGVVWIISGPQGGVRLSNDMESYATEYLENNEILNSSEALIAYYDVTISLIGTEAAILTTERVIYYKNGKSSAIELSDITDIRHREEGLIGDIIEIDSRSGIPMKIEISFFNGGQTFLNALRKAWERSK